MKHLLADEEHRFVSFSGSRAKAMEALLDILRSFLLFDGLTHCAGVYNKMI